MVPRRVPSLLTPPPAHLYLSPGPRSPPPPRGRAPTSVTPPPTSSPHPTLSEAQTTCGKPARGSVLCATWGCWAWRVGRGGGRGPGRAWVRVASGCSGIGGAGLAPPRGSRPEFSHSFRVQPSDSEVTSISETSWTPSPWRRLGGPFQGSQRDPLGGPSSPQGTALVLPGPTLAV